MVLGGRVPDIYMYAVGSGYDCSSNAECRTGVLSAWLTAGLPVVRWFLTTKLLVQQFVYSRRMRSARQLVNLPSLRYFRCCCTTRDGDRSLNLAFNRLYSAASCAKDQPGEQESKLHRVMGSMDRSRGTNARHERSF